MVMEFFYQEYVVSKQEMQETPEKMALLSCQPPEVSTLTGPIDW